MRWWCMFFKKKSRAFFFFIFFPPHFLTLTHKFVFFPMKFLLLSVHADPHSSAVTALLLGPGSLIILTPKNNPGSDLSQKPFKWPAHWIHLNFPACLNFWFCQLCATTVPLDSLPLPLEHRGGGGGDVQAADRQMKNETQSVVSQRANDACGDYRLQSAS